LNASIHAASRGETGGGRLAQCPSGLRRGRFRDVVRGSVGAHPPLGNELRVLGAEAAEDLPLVADNSIPSSARSLFSAISSSGTGGLMRPS